MNCGNVVVSESLFRLVIENAGQSPCLKLLSKILVQSRIKLLNPRLPGNYFSFREQQGLISYCPRGREQQFSATGRWSRTGRIGMKPGRWIKTMLHPRLARRLGDEDYATFATVIKHEELKSVLSFEVVSPDAAYDFRNFVGDIDSCMWGQPVGPFYRSFKAEALVAKNGANEWVGRAILWRNVRLTRSSPLAPEKPPLPPKKITFLDRVFARSEEVAFGMIKYAQEQGWYHKAGMNNSPDEAIVDPGCIHLVGRLSVETDADLRQIEFYPYLDTLCYGDESSLNNFNHDSFYKYRNTDGTRTGGDQVRDIDGRLIDSDDAVLVQGEYYAIDDGRIVRCARSDEWARVSDCYRIELRGVEGWEGEDYVYIHHTYVKNVSRR